MYTVHSHSLSLWLNIMILRVLYIIHNVYINIFFVFYIFNRRRREANAIIILYSIEIINGNYNSGYDEHNINVKRNNIARVFGVLFEWLFFQSFYDFLRSNSTLKAADFQGHFFFSLPSHSLSLSILPPPPPKCIYYVVHITDARA